MSLLVFDFGTSYFKAAVFSDAGRLQHLHRQPSPITTTGGRREMTPETFLGAVQAAIAALGRECDQQTVHAVCYSTMANTLTLLDAAGRHLTPLILWDDVRAADLEPLVQTWSQDPAFLSSTGLPVLTHQFSLIRLRWLAEHLADWPRVRRVLFLNDLFTHWLTGRTVSEASIAWISGLFDVPAWRWSPDLCERARVRIDHLPPVVRGGDVVGEILPAVAAELGLPTGCRLVAGCLDQFAGAVGVGNVAPGGLSTTAGTVLTTVRKLADFTPAPGLFCGPAAGSGFYRMAVGDVSAALLEHYRNALPDRPGFDKLPPAAKTALKLDHRRRLAELKSTVTAWAPTQPRGEVVRAILDAIAANLADQVAQVTAGDSITELRAAGGLARSRAWLQTCADLLQVPLIAPSNEEPALTGAAALAAKAIGLRGFNGDAETDPSRILLPRRGRNHH